MARQTFNLGPLTGTTALQYSAPGGHLLNASFFDDEVAKYFTFLRLNNSGSINLSISNTDTDNSIEGQDFSTQFESQGQITVESGGQSVVLTFPISDQTERYLWTPSNSAEVQAWISAYISGTDVFVTFDDDPIRFTDAAQEINYNETASLEAIISSDYVSQVWSGDGTFTNPNSASTVWTPPTTLVDTTYVLRITGTLSGGDTSFSEARVTVLGPSFQTFNLGPLTGTTALQYSAPGGHLLNASFFDDEVAKYFTFLRLNNSGSINLSISNTDTDNSIEGQDFSTQFESQGQITVESGGQSVVLTFPISDQTERYLWTPSNSAEVQAWISAYISGTDVFVTFDDGSALPPSFSDDTGTAQSWIRNAAIATITVPAASGNPTPTYAVVGSLPTGIQFNQTTRVLSGTPTIIGSGTITIRATNSEGDDDWTVAYTTRSIPAFSDNTGDAQTWTVGTAIADITVPTASGSPTPTYAAIGTLPSGIQFNTNTRVISGIPTASDSDTITIRATNSAGSDDWTVAYVAQEEITRTITGLDPATEYEVQFLATNSIGSSAYSPSGRGTTQGAALTAPVLQTIRAPLSPGLPIQRSHRLPFPLQQATRRPPML